MYQVPVESFAGSAPLSSAGQVLVVDDDAEVREALRDVLTDEGFDVKVAANGADALDALDRDGAPAVIILDLMMPVMDGYEFLKQREQNPSLRQVPVVVVSATIDPRVESERVIVLRKPIDLERLLATIADLRA